jgi:hypothetical protein
MLSLIVNSPWDAAKHMESAAALAQKLSIWNEVADFYKGVGAVC